MSKDQRCKTSELHFANWLFGLEKFSGLLRNRLQLLRVVAISVGMHSTVSTEQRQVTMENCFGLVRPHQHGVDDMHLQRRFVKTPLAAAPLAISSLKVENLWSTIYWLTCTCNVSYLSHQN